MPEATEKEVENTEQPSGETKETTPAVASMSETSTILFSPEGIMMMGIAMGLDLAGLVDLIPVVGNVLSYLVDFSGILIIGGWTYFRSQSIQVSGRAATKVGKVTQWTKRLRWLRPLLIIGEFIPIVGTLPLWTLLVYFELKT